MSTQQINRGIIYLATHPKCNEAIIGYGYHLESVKNSLKNYNSPARATYPGGKLIEDFGGIDAWNWSILDDVMYSKKKEVYNIFLKEHDQIKYKYEWQKLSDLRCFPVNHEVVEWSFVELV